MKPTPIPKGFTSVTPYLILESAEEGIKFYERAFGGSLIRKMEFKGKLMHAEIKIGNAYIMLADEFPDQGFKSPKSYGGSPAFIHLYVEDADTSFKLALEAGAKEIIPVSDQFFGDRHGILLDPYGYTWTIATRIEDISDAEIDKRIQGYESQD